MPTESCGPTECPICRAQIDLYSFGKCDHPTCLKCALKLRKFENKSETYSVCPTCRRVLKEVAVTWSFLPFSELDRKVMKSGSENYFLFASLEIQNHFNSLIACKCIICGIEKESMSALNRHTNNEHKKSYCDLCIQHARLLPCEFPIMDAKELSEHRKWNKKKKLGHPICAFCDSRFYEEEDLIEHVRSVHYTCEVCDSAGEYVVFGNHDHLYRHYNDAHFICRDCESVGRIITFGTVNQLGMHRLQEHPSSVAADPHSWLPFQFKMAPISETVRGIDTRRSRGYGNINNADNPSSSESATQITRPQFIRPTDDDFPSLSNTSTSHPLGRTPDIQTSHINGHQRPSTGRSITSSTPSSSNFTSLAAILGAAPVTKNMDEEFPSLPSSGSSDAKSFGGSIIGAPKRTTKHSGNFNTGPSAWTSKVLENISEGIPTTDPGASKLDFSNTRPLSSRLSSSTKFRPQAPPTPADFPSLPPAGKFTESSQKPRTPLASLPSELAQLSLLPLSQSSSQKETHIKDHGSVSYSGKIKSSPMNEPAINQIRISGRVRHRAVWCPSTEPNSFHFPQGQDEISPLQTDEPKINNMVKPGPEDFPALPGSSSMISKTVSKLGKPSVDSKLTSDRKEPHPNNHKEKKEGNQKAKKKPDVEVDSTQILSNKSQSVQQNKTKKKQEKHRSDETDGPRESYLGIPITEDTETLIFSKSSYTPWPNESGRNHQLSKTLQSSFANMLSVSKSAFNQFLDFSRRYRARQLTSSAYLDGLAGLLRSLDVETPPSASDSNLQAPIKNKLPISVDISWMAEMLVCLPDIGLQRAFLRELSGEGAARLPISGDKGFGGDLPDWLRQELSKIKRPRARIPPGWAKNVVALIVPCRYCGQVCLRNELKLHIDLAGHSGNTPF